ncbi:hypothetical protein LXL04_027368 [Taraxacum kok-saghyz]
MKKGEEDRISALPDWLLLEILSRLPSRKDAIRTGFHSRKFQKIMEKREEDRISALPDCLLLEILSRLPTTKSAIKTGILSKRWKQIWTLLPVLIFKCTVDNRTPSDFVSFVDKTLTQCRQLKLGKLVLSTYRDIQFQPQLSNWIRYAISCNVEELRLSLKSADSRVKFEFDQNFFISSCFTDMALVGCVLNPTGAICWKNLKTFYIDHTNLDEDMIENILSGSPVLETLVLDSCYGFKLIDITSKSVKNLVFTGYPKCQVTHDEVGEIIKINAPNILSLSIQEDLVLWKLLLLDVSSLIKVYLDYYTLDRYFDPTPKEAEEEMLKGFILKTRHVKELEIGSYCYKVVSRLEAKGFEFPSNVKFSDETWCDEDSVENED